MPTKVHLVKTMVFLVVMYGCEIWTMKKAEHQRTDAFELWCWRRLLRVPWTPRRSNQSILKEISPEYSLEGLMLKLRRRGISHRGGRKQRGPQLHNQRDKDVGGVKRKHWGGFISLDQSAKERPDSPPTIQPLPLAKPIWREGGQSP